MSNIHSTLEEGFKTIKSLESVPKILLAEQELAIFAIASINSEDGEDDKNMRGVIMGEPDEIGLTLSRAVPHMPANLVIALISAIITGFFNHDDLSKSEKKTLTNNIIKALEKRLPSFDEGSSLDDFLKNLNISLN